MKQEQANKYEKFMASWMRPTCNRAWCDLLHGLCDTDTQYLKRAGVALEVFMKKQDTKAPIRPEPNPTGKIRKSF